MRGHGMDPGDTCESNREGCEEDGRVREEDGSPDVVSRGVHRCLALHVVSLTDHDMFQDPHEASSRDQGIPRRNEEYHGHDSPAVADAVIGGCLEMVRGRLRTGESGEACLGGRGWGMAAWWWWR